MPSLTSTSTARRASSWCTFTLDLQAGGGSPDEAKAFVASEIVKWGPLIKKVNIRM